MDEESEERVETKQDVLPFEIPKKSFTCVEYPAKIVNTERMLKTLGGEEAVSKAVGSVGQRLEMKFRPEDPFCKSVCSNRYSTSNILLKVKRRRRKNKEAQPGPLSAQSPDDKDEEISCEALGVINKTYKFQGMADFQYLPVIRTPKGNFESILKDVIPSSPSDMSFFEKDVPFFLLPAHFSRIDTPSNYSFQKDAFMNMSKSEMSVEKTLIGRNRKRRATGAYLVDLVLGDIPMEPKPVALEIAKKVKIEDQQMALKKMFDECPIWSRNAVLCNSDISSEHLKLVNPSIAFYCTNGAWRTLWCRFGYDPRKHPEAKKYQILDFRLRKNIFARAKSIISCKGNYKLYSQPGYFNPRTDKGPTIMESDPQTPKTKDAYYIMAKGVIPPYPQMFYRLCDLRDEELQDLIAKSPVRESCHPKTGWYPEDLFSQLRDKVTQMISESLEQRKETAG